MAKKTATRPPGVTITAGTCTLFATWPMRCPLCKLEIPANTPHHCENPRVQDEPTLSKRQG